MSLASPATTKTAAIDPAIPRSVGRVLDLLEVVLSRGTCNLTTAASACDLTPTTALRHLRALEARGYLDRDAHGAFGAGPAILRIAAALHELGPLDGLLAASQPHLDALAAKIGESSYLAVSDRRVATYVATAESDRAIRHVGWIGQNVKLHGTAVGEALADPGKVYIRTGAVEPDITALSIALPNTDRLGIALSVIGPEHRLDLETCRRAEAELAQTAQQLARELGLDHEPSGA